MKKKYEISKFSIAEATSNTNGKTSGSGVVGVYLGIIGGIGFLLGVIAFYFHIPNVVELLDKSILLAGISAVLLGARKLKTTNITNETDTDQTDNKNVI